MTWTPPPYPYDRLAPLRDKAAALPGGLVDLSIGDPTDAPPPAVVAALSSSGAERSYPTSVGSPEFRAAASAWLADRLNVVVPTSLIGACVGTKEFVAGLPGWLRLRDPSRDTVLFPAVSYPTYAMGAVLAGCRAVAVPVDTSGCLVLASVDEADAARALCLWVNSPGNPAGGLDDLDAAAAWGRARGVPVISDECYVEFTWRGPRRTILGAGLEGVIALHSLSKRSNLAGIRSGFYAGDPDLMAFLLELRKHAGLMTPGPVLAAATVALSDQAHVDAQRERYWERLNRLRDIVALAGAEAPLPGGGFYLWVPAPDGDDWGFVERLATEGGLLGSPGEFYGEAGRGHVRLAAVAPLDRLDLVASRLAG
ncbi:MAG TPA: pyridoxal phosphate-dependent aminotransferase [Acidimicrobiia bacterium]|nr:pyridoxal phosphate-dependent aminotransferase [Acidimicrobiia bacterium]